MEISEQLCRLCRQESEHLESLQGYRDGLPISVIIMIICPVKIKPKDELPKFVCGDCLEVVMCAYKLREDSLESDRYFRENVETRLINEEQEISIKLENEIEFAEALPLPSVSTFQPPRKKIKITRMPAMGKTIDEDSDDDNVQVEELDKRFDDKPTFTCHFCGRSLRHKIDMEKHLKVHEDKRDLIKRSEKDELTQEDCSSIVDESESYDVWSQVVKKKQTQDKYKVYVEIVDIFTERESSKKKRKTNDSNDLVPPKDISKFHFYCKLCKKIFVGMLNSTSNIRSHLGRCHKIDLEEFDTANKTASKNT